MYELIKYRVIKSFQQTYKILTCKYTTKVFRVRFAPSPTGYLHLGGLRTALYNFLFAKLHNGKFILRIEDTDQTRLVDGATEQLQNDLIWSGIEINEGPTIGGDFGPYIQSERLNLYRDQVQKLINNGSAYYCFCTNKRLELLRKESLKIRQIPKYDNRCRHLTREDVSKRLDRGDTHCVRFKLLPGLESFNDLIYGKVSYDVTLNEGDPVIMKSDGYPTYHFANVVDDHFMNISHVLRGVEWQISTTKHLLLYRAFNWTPPVFGHLPLLMNADGTKLSKRQGDIQISYYRNNGILPLALINFITNSGGGFEKDHERGLKQRSYTIEKLANQFDVKKINVSSGKLMPERLLEFNRLEIDRQLQNKEDVEFLVQEIKSLIKQTFPERYSNDTLQIDDDHIKTVLKWSVMRINCISDLVSKDLKFLWVVPDNAENITEDQLIAIKNLNKYLEESTEDFNKNNIFLLLNQFASANNIQFSIFMKLLRKILSGLKEGPSVGEMMEILGKENTLLRISTFLKNNWR